MYNPILATTVIVVAGLAAAGILLWPIWALLYVVITAVLGTIF